MSEKHPTHPTPRPNLTREPADAEALARRHQQVGWWSLLVFLALGILLEALHGFKVGAYLGVGSGTRRLMWTLAHAHGTLLALVHLGFASSLPRLPRWPAPGRRLTATALTASTLLIPLGFFLGGCVIHGGDPGLGILLVPVGALLLLAAVFSVARECSRQA